MDKGIVVAGNLIVDYVKMIDCYPEKGRLSNIISAKRCVGGCAANTAVDLARLDCCVPVKSVGMIGDDENGQYILDVLNENNVSTESILKSEKLPTSFTDVMTVSETGERTFFHARGANKDFSLDHIDYKSIKGDLFHIGYALLLDSLDAEDKEYGTVMAKTLAKAKEHGFKTSMDVVSENSNRFKKIVTPSLKYCDHLIINEVEASLVCEIPARNAAGEIIYENVCEICRKLFQLGVNEKVVIHAPEGGWYMDKECYTFVPALKLPDGYIKGTVGAGDAFCAGILHSIYKGLPPQKCLRIAASVAAASLSAENSIDGVGPIAEVLELERKYSATHSGFNPKT